MMMISWVSPTKELTVCMSATDYACHFASRILCVIITILLPFHPHTNIQIPILILYGAHAGHVHTDPEFSVFFRLLISYLMCFKTRCFFYVSWLLGDSVSNAAGLGFNGYDKEGSARWDLVSVGRYRDIELPLTPVSVARGWNIPTALWLKR